MANEKHASSLWRTEQAGIDKQELVEEGSICHENLDRFMIYRFISSAGYPESISINGTLTCACGYGIPLNATLSFKGFFDYRSQYNHTCPQCWVGIELVGETTGSGDSRKHWLLLTPTTGKEGIVEMPGTTSGLPELSIGQIEQITYESKKPEQKPKIDKSSGAPEATDSRSVKPFTNETVKGISNYSGDDLLPSELIKNLFSKREGIKPGRKEILAIVFLYEQLPAPYAWTGLGPDPFAMGSESDEIRQLRFFLSKIIPGFQPRFIPPHLRMGSKTLITGRQIQPGERIDIEYVNPMLAVMLADLLEDNKILDALNLSECSALSLAGNSIATGEARFAFLIK